MKITLHYKKKTITGLIGIQCPQQGVLGAAPWDPMTMEGSLLVGVKGDTPTIKPQHHLCRQVQTRQLTIHQLLKRLLRLQRQRQLTEILYSITIRNVIQLRQRAPFLKFQSIESSQALVVQKRHDFAQLD